MNYEEMDIALLQKLYDEQAKELEQAVLSGNLWEMVRVKRKRLTELSKILHEKLQEAKSKTPAEEQLRKEGRR